MLLTGSTNIKPEFVAPFVAAVSHPNGPDASGKIFEVGAGYVAEVRWERSNGAVFRTDASFTPSAVSYPILIVILYILTSVFR